VARLYRCALALVFPSLLEGFGLPVLEAMAAGAPVITSDRSSLPEVAGDAALLVDPENTEALADAMRCVAADEALRQRLRAAGRARAREFTWDRAARETLAVFDEAAAS
jgi:glycosyltransferase involved in cell wall biosynthesis